jgi:hypothetical protein
MLMVWFLGTCTVLGGLAALWFFWDKITGWFRRPPPAPPEPEPLVDDERVNRVVDAFCAPNQRDHGGVFRFIHAGAALLRSPEEVAEAAERIRLRGCGMFPLPYVEQEIPQEQWLEFLQWHARRHPESKFYFNARDFGKLKAIYEQERQAQPEN